jgi:hypothetical protein
VLEASNRFPTTKEGLDKENAFGKKTEHVLTETAKIAQRSEPLVFKLPIRSASGTQTNAPLRTVHRASYVVLRPLTEKEKYLSIPVALVNLRLMAGRRIKQQMHLTTSDASSSRANFEIYVNTVVPSGKFS